MSDTATEIVNLCDDMPRRPTKRSRPERQETKVLNLVDSDDDSPSSVPRPRDQVAQGIERNPIMLTHWGAMEGQGAPRPMPVYRPSSARSRRVALPLPRVNVNTSPIAIDDDDEDENLVQRSTLKHHIPGMPRHQASGADSQANDFTRPPMLPSAPRLVPSTSIAAQQQQQHHHQPQPVQGQDMSAETQHESFGPWRGMLPPVRPARRPFRSMARSDAPGSINQPASHQRLVQGQHAPLPDVDGIEDQEDADMRLAARLQAEEDERLARETIHQMEQEEHRNVMSRLDMLESLENASLAESIRRERERAATRRSERVERFGGGGMVGPGSGDQEYDQDGLTWRAWSRPTRAPGSGSMSIFGGPGGGGDANRAAEAAVLAAAAEEAATAAAAAAAGPAGGSHPRFIARSLQDMIPAMMALPFGFYRIMGGRGDSDDNVGTQRRARHAVATAYREQAVAMREQILAAHRAGIPAHLLLSDRDFTPEDYELLCRLDEGVENRKAAKDEQLAALPTEIVGVEGRRRSDGCQATCIICMEEVVPGDVLKRLPCLHDFHGNCVDTWLKTKACCPICQRGLDTAA
ncbi:hypothetical protein Vretimale_10607 [Volvox reticuliferus]|uniref:RING-type domain-containing protein n=1 Tax=Volvox reticuliferus TaxID=1737510 RepID=A0A8J4CL91_9CHLO|nr:hypothetical protein Vretifemale_13974 [Volvox reticuliferus]GIM06249.1 hypothetical protein Vretimale_10607 [Volvox reticuliferus]